VSANNAPLPGKTVQFTSSNATVATVTPASATSDATGQARVTVAGVTPGNASVTANVEGAQAAAAITVAAKVSAWSWVGWAALLALSALGVVRWQWLSRRRGARAVRVQSR
jgi:hypothetical protein